MLARTLKYEIGAGFGNKGFPRNSSRGRLQIYKKRVSNKEKRIDQNAVLGVQDYL
jgi:hypothetical protein